MAQSLESQIDEINEDIERLEKKRDRLEELVVERDNQTPLQKIATALHQSLCEDDHKDNCDWEQYSWTYTGFAHKYYLKMAENMRNVTGPFPTLAYKMVYLRTLAEALGS